MLTASLMVALATPAPTPSPTDSAAPTASAVTPDYIEARDALLEAGVLVASFAGGFLVAVRV